jgi:hypothetical protein
MSSVRVGPSHGGSKQPFSEALVTPYFHSHSLTTSISLRPKEIRQKVFGFVF